MEITLIFPNQLYRNHPAIHHGSVVYIVEDPLYFTQFPFHKKKLILHRASMKCYAESLLQRGVTIEYVESKSAISSTEMLFRHLCDAGVKTVRYCDTTDYLLERRLERYSKQNAIQLMQIESPNFLTSRAEINAFFGSGRRFFMADFYKFQRKRLGILVNNNQPVGGRWSFDEENRRKLPKGTIVPEFPTYMIDRFLHEAMDYVHYHFPDNYGSAEDFMFPVDHDGAEKLFRDFLEQRLHHFGIYQDAIVHQHHFLFHSVISSSLNTGLLDPHYVVEQTVKYAEENQVPLNSVEGFLRQVIGWREYIRAVYILKGVEERTKNYFGFSRQLPAGFWNATTDIAPLDSVIDRLLRSSYSHHIERLMIMGNFMLLCEIDPDEVYRWFMTFYIDAYDWVMVPNVYGMSQFADGGMMSTKPYISSSNYLLKMSDFKKGPWSATWDALFWRFMVVHADVFEKNQRLSFLLRTWNTMDANKKSAHLTLAERYLHSLDNNISQRLF